MASRFALSPFTSFQGDRGGVAAEHRSQITCKSRRGPGGLCLDLSFPSICPQIVVGCGGVHLQAGWLRGLSNVT